MHPAAEDAKMAETGVFFLAIFGAPWRPRLLVTHRFLMWLLLQPKRIVESLNVKACSELIPGCAFFARRHHFAVVCMGLKIAFESPHFQEWCSTYRCHIPSHCLTEAILILHSFAFQRNFSSLLCKNFTSHHRLWSSKKVTKYRAPPIDCVGIGPQLSECTISRVDF